MGFLPGRNPIFRLDLNGFSFIREFFRLFEQILNFNNDHKKAPQYGVRSSCQNHLDEAVNNMLTIFNRLLSIFFLSLI